MRSPECPECGGEGRVDMAHPSGDPQRSYDAPCPSCQVEPEPDYEAIAEARAIRRGIGEVPR